MTKHAVFLRSATALVALSLATVLMGAGSGPVTASTADARVSVGGPTTPFVQNIQAEPAIAIDANHPNVMAAGSDDQIDKQACGAGDPTDCSFGFGVGWAGAYFSFDAGRTWMQPTYTGWTARHCLGPEECQPHVGPIGTVPKYYEQGLQNDGDPALAFGPRPDARGHFSWTNGSRLYYETAALNFSSARPQDREFLGSFAVAVSRIDGKPALTPEIVSDQSNWKSPVLVSQQNQTEFSDKPQMWADNAASSPYFGRVYVCYTAFRSPGNGSAGSVPLMVSVSTDGGDTWFTRQVSAATANNEQGWRHGCALRTDSRGVVYVFDSHFNQSPTESGCCIDGHLMFRSLDGGQTWQRERTVQRVTDPCIVHDFGGAGWCIEDGTGGARNDLAAMPSIDIANGAPTGADATNEIIDTWVDGSDGLNHEHATVSKSMNGGTTWSPPVAVEQPGDRGFQAAVAMSPNGKDTYVVYNAVRTPFQEVTNTPRSLQAVVLHADIASDGTPTEWTEIHRGPLGDMRGTALTGFHGQHQEWLGDYVFAAATRTYGAAVWTDVRNAADCPAIDAWRQSVRSGGSVPRPAPDTDCPPTFGNSDIYGGSWADPTP